MLARDSVKLIDAAVFDVLSGDDFCRGEVGVSALPWLVKALNGLTGSVHGSLQCVLWQFAMGGKTMALEFCQIIVEFFRHNECDTFASRSCRVSMSQILPANRAHSLAAG